MEVILGLVGRLEVSLQMVDEYSQHSGLCTGGNPLFVMSQRALVPNCTRVGRNNPTNVVVASFAKANHQFVLTCLLFVM